MHIFHELRFYSNTCKLITTLILEIENQIHLSTCLANGIERDLGGDEGVGMWGWGYETKFQHIFEYCDTSQEQTHMDDALLELADDVQL